MKTHPLVSRLLTASADLEHVAQVYDREKDNLPVPPILDYVRTLETLIESMLNAIDPLPEVDSMILPFPGE